MASYATVAIRIFKKLSKGGTDEAKAWAAYERFAGGESAESIWKLIETCNRRHWFFFHGKKNTPCGIANAKRTFGHAAICAFVNACYDGAHPQASYTCTHDLDDLSYTREGLETFARRMVETAWSKRHGACAKITRVFTMRLSLTRPATTSKVATGSMILSIAGNRGGGGGSPRTKNQKI